MPNNDLYCILIILRNVFDPLAFFDLNELKNDSTIFFKIASNESISHNKMQYKYLLGIKVDPHSFSWSGWSVTPDLWEKPCNHSKMI